nr:hypothetical protein [Kangsaoukella pontilimi]
MKPAATIAAAIAIGSGPVSAGNLATPAIEPEVVMAPETVAAGAATSGGFVVPLIFLVILAAVASGGGDGVVLPEE